MERKGNELRNIGKGYSGRALGDKLGLKDGMKAICIEAPSEYYSWLGESSSIFNNANTPPFDFIHVFENTLSGLENHLSDLRNKIHPNGMIWVSWYKKSSGLKSEITEDLIRDTCFPLGMVDVKVCAVNEAWSGLKLVIRKKNR